MQRILDSWHEKKVKSMVSEDKRDNACLIWSNGVLICLLSTWNKWLTESITRGESSKEPSAEKWVNEDVLLDRAQPNALRTVELTSLQPYMWFSRNYLALWTLFHTLIKKKKISSICRPYGFADDKNSELSRRRNRSNNYAILNCVAEPYYRPRDLSFLSEWTLEPVRVREGRGEIL